MLNSYTNTRLISAAVIVSFLLNLLILPISAKHQGLNEFYYKRNPGKNIALTFDDGPHPIYTPKILKILSKYNIKATFFIIGENVKYYGEVLNDIVKDGHELGNHTFSHKNIKNKNTEDILDEIKKCNDAIYQACGVKTLLFRPPGGIMADVCIANIDILSDYNIIYWSIDTHDWAHESPEKISNNVLKAIKSGDIILMHDFIGRNSPTPAALELMIPKLQEKGYNFVTVSELIA